MYTLTDIKATRSVVYPAGLSSVKFVASVNTSDKADVLAGQTLAWTGTADTNVANEIKDTSEVFDPALNGSFAANTADGAGASFTVTGKVDYKDADELYVKSGYNNVAATTGNTGEGDDARILGDLPYDLCPDGNETYTIYDEHKIQVIAVTANDDGTLFVMG
jgi:hypothetical protein